MLGFSSYHHIGQFFFIKFFVKFFEGHTLMGLVYIAPGCPRAGGNRNFWPGGAGNPVSFAFKSICLGNTGIHPIKTNLHSNSQGFVYCRVQCICTGLNLRGKSKSWFMTFRNLYFAPKWQIINVLYKVGCRPKVMIHNLLIVNKLQEKIFGGFKYPFYICPAKQTLTAIFWIARFKLFPREPVVNPVNSPPLVFVWHTGDFFISLLQTSTHAKQTKKEPAGEVQ